MVTPQRNPLGRNHSLVLSYGRSKRWAKILLPSDYLFKNLPNSSKRLLISHKSKCLQPPLGMSMPPLQSLLVRWSCQIHDSQSFCSSAMLRISACVWCTLLHAVQQLSGLSPQQLLDFSDAIQQLFYCMLDHVIFCFLFWCHDTSGRSF